jgi:3-hydroxyisobutyrate dehydrogenase/2-hydroxy-3-oxopropionate reductase
VTAVAFCGLGQMGSAMARRLLHAGHDLMVWNRTPAKAAPLVEAGAKEASSPAEATRGAEVTVTMLATPDALEQVVLGDSGLASAMADRSTLIDMSTVGADTVKRLRARLDPQVGLLDAPVLGSVSAAADGTLKVFVGGPPELVDRWTPLLSELGRPVHFGPLGSGAAMKLVANLVLGVLMSGLGEALALADALGLEQGQVLDALAESPIGATVKSKRDKIDDDRFPPNFKLSLAAKDLRLVTEAAAGAGVELRLAPSARAWLEAAEAAGMGQLDYSAVIAAVRGREAREG